MTRPKNPAAVALAKMGKGVKRNFSPDDLARRRKLMEKINDLRARRIALNKKVNKIAKLKYDQALEMVESKHKPTKPRKSKERG